MKWSHFRRCDWDPVPPEMAIGHTSAQTAARRRGWTATYFSQLADQLFSASCTVWTNAFSPSPSNLIGSVQSKNEERLAGQLGAIGQPFLRSLHRDTHRPRKSDSSYFRLVGSARPTDLKVWA